MTSTRFLKYEVSLLLAKYGRDAVLNALARELNSSETELEALLGDIDKKKTTPRISREPSAADQLEKIVAQHPGKASPLRTLHTRFQNRTFLPELRDVRRFFDQHSQNLGRAKSRSASFPKLCRLLAELDDAELEALCDVGEAGEPSSLGIISDEILRHHR